MRKNQCVFVSMFVVSYLMGAVSYAADTDVNEFLKELSISNSEDLKKERAEIIKQMRDLKTASPDLKKKKAEADANLAKTKAQGDFINYLAKKKIALDTQELQKAVTASLADDRGNLSEANIRTFQAEDAAKRVKTVTVSLGDDNPLQVVVEVKPEKNKPLSGDNKNLEMSFRVEAKDDALTKLKASTQPSERRIADEIKKEDLNDYIKTNVGVVDPDKNKVVIETNGVKETSTVALGPDGKPLMESDGKTPKTTTKVESKLTKPDEITDGAKKLADNTKESVEANIASEKGDVGADAKGPATKVALAKDEVDKSAADLDVTAKKKELDAKLKALELVQKGSKIEGSTCKFMIEKLGLKYNDLSDADKADCPELAPKASKKEKAESEEEAKKDKAEIQQQTADVAQQLAHAVQMCRATYWNQAAQGPQKSLVEQINPIYQQMVKQGIPSETLAQLMIEGAPYGYSFFGDPGNLKNESDKIAQAIPKNEEGLKKLKAELDSLGRIAKVMAATLMGVAASSPEGLSPGSPLLNDPSVNQLMNASSSAQALIAALSEEINKRDADLASKKAKGVFTNPNGVPTTGGVPVNSGTPIAPINRMGGGLRPADQRLRMQPRTNTNYNQ